MVRFLYFCEHCEEYLEWEAPDMTLDEAQSMDKDELPGETCPTCGRDMTLDEVY